MKPKLLASFLLIAAALAPPAGAQGTPADVPLVRMRDGHGSDLLFRVQPRTLRPVGRPIRTFRSGAGLGFSPDGRRIAYTDGSRSSSRIQFMDLVSWRSMGVAELGRRGPLSVAWVSPERVIAMTGQGYGRQRVFLVDARTRTVVARRAFSGLLLGSAAVPGGHAIALAPNRGIGPVRILLVDGDARLRTIVLEGIRAGGTEARRRGRFLTPALTVDPEGGRLYVVAANEPLVAELELTSGAVSYHSLGASASKGNVDVWYRQAAWAGDGRIAVTGERWRPARGRRPPPPPEPFGVRVIDTRDWSITTLDRRPTGMQVAGDTLLATGTRWFPSGGRPAEYTGLLAFAGGRPAFHRFAGRDVVLCGSRGNLGYVWVRRMRTVHVIDLRDGQTLREVSTGRRPPFLLSPSP